MRNRLSMLLCSRLSLDGASRVCDCCSGRRPCHAPAGPGQVSPRGTGLSLPSRGSRITVGETNVLSLKRESEGRVLLDALRRAAAALGCNLVHALVPRRPLEQVVQVRLELDGRWLVLPIHENVDVDIWARGLVKEALRAREVHVVKGARKVYADMYAELLTGLRATAEEPDLKLMMAYCYVPDGNLLYAAMAKMVIIVLPELSTLDDAVASLVAPAGANYGDARIEELATASGPCIRVQQLLLDPETGGDSGVTSSLAYLWKTQQDGVFLVLACTFASPVEGALHESAMDELASTLRKGARV